MKLHSKPTPRLWYKARLTPMATGLYTDAFYPQPKKRTGAQYVYFTQIDITPTTHKVVVASRMAESGIRLMTQELASKCLIPHHKATKAEMAQLNDLSQNLKI